VAETQLVVFKLAGEQFAAPITRVREILRPVRPTRMPRAAAFVRGLFNLRGQVLPLLDLRARLGLKEMATVQQRRVRRQQLDGRYLNAIAFADRFARRTVGLL